MDITLERILNELKTRKMKQKQLLEFLDLKENTFANWKAGHNVSYRKYIHAIAEYLGVSVEYLRGETDQKEKPLSDSIPEKNTIKIAGRDGSYLERRLTDDQLDLIKKMINQMPEANDL